MCGQVFRRSKHNNCNRGCLYGLINLFRGFLPGSATIVDYMKVREDLANMATIGNPGLTGGTLEKDRPYQGQPKTPASADNPNNQRPTVKLVEPQRENNVQQQPSKPDLSYLGPGATRAPSNRVLLGDDQHNQCEQQPEFQQPTTRTPKPVLLGQQDLSSEEQHPPIIPIRQPSRTQIPGNMGQQQQLVQKISVVQQQSSRVRYKIRLGLGTDAHTVTEITRLNIFKIYNPIELLFSVLPRIILFPLGFMTKPFVTSATIYPANAIIVFNLSNGRKEVRIAGVFDRTGYQNKIKTEGAKKYTLLPTIKQLKTTDPLCNLIKAKAMDHSVPNYSDELLINERNELEKLGLWYLVRALPQDKSAGY